MRNVDGTQITIETFNNTPAELVELGIAKVKEQSVEYLETRVSVSGIRCPNPFCGDTKQVRIDELDARWRYCPHCATIWTIDELLGLVYIMLALEVQT